MATAQKPPYKPRTPSRLMMAFTVCFMARPCSCLFKHQSVQTFISTQYTFQVAHIQALILVAMSKAYFIIGRQRKTGCYVSIDCLFYNPSSVQSPGEDLVLSPQNLYMPNLTVDFGEPPRSGKLFAIGPILCNEEVKLVMELGAGQPLFKCSYPCPFPLR